jgi:hypothetical protein
VVSKPHLRLDTPREADSQDRSEVLKPLLSIYGKSPSVSKENLAVVQPSLCLPYLISSIGPKSKLTTIPAYVIELKEVIMKAYTPKERLDRVYMRQYPDRVPVSLFLLAYGAKLSGCNVKEFNTDPEKNVKSVLAHLWLHRSNYGRYGLRWGGIDKH